MREKGVEALVWSVRDSTRTRAKGKGVGASSAEMQKRGGGNHGKRVNKPGPPNLWRHVNLGGG